VTNALTTFQHCSRGGTLGGSPEVPPTTTIFFPFSLSTEATISTASLPLVDPTLQLVRPGLSSRRLFLAAHRPQ